MQMFADEPDAVKRLMASQYRVAPERLMRTGTFGNAPFPCKFCLENTYRIVASTSPSRIEAHAGLFRSLMKGIFGPYVL